MSDTMAMAAAVTKTTARRPLHIESELSQGELPWRGHGTHKMLYTMRDVDSSESPPPPPPPSRIPLTLLTRGSAANDIKANNSTKHSSQEEQDDKTEHTLKSVSDLVHKFETKIRNASSSTKKKYHDVSKSSTNGTAKATRSKSPTTKSHYYKGSSDETSEISDDDENYDDDDVTALSVSEKTKFFEHLSTRNSSPVHADYYNSNAKLAGAPHFQTKFIHAALRSQLLRSSSTGTLGKIPPLQQQILSLQVLNKSGNIALPKPSTSQSPEGATRTTAATPSGDSRYIPQPLHLHRQASAQTQSTVVVDIHSPLKNQLRKNHYDRIYKRSKRQMQHHNSTVPVDDDVSSLTVPSFLEKKDSQRTGEPIITNKDTNNLESNSSQQRYWTQTKGQTDTNGTPNAEPCDPNISSPLEHDNENLQQHRSHNYYELIAYAESLKEMPTNRSKRELFSTFFSKNSSQDLQEQEVSQVNKYASAPSPIKHVSQQSSLLPLKTNVSHNQSDRLPERTPENRVLVAPRSGDPAASKGMEKESKIGAQVDMNKTSRTDMMLDQQGGIEQREGHDVRNQHILSAEVSPQVRHADDESPSREKSSHEYEEEGEQDCTIVPSPDSNYFTPPIYSRKTLSVVPTSDLQTDTICAAHSDMRLLCPESPAPSDEAAANDSNNGDAPSDEKQMPRLSKFIPQQRIPKSVTSSLKENIPVPKVTGAPGRKKRFSHHDEPPKSAEKGSSARKRRESKVTSSVYLESTANTKRPLRSVPLAPVEPSIRSRVQTFNEKRQEVSRQNAGLPPRKPNFSANDDFHLPGTRMRNLMSDSSDALMPSTTQNPKVPVNESRESFDEKKINTAQVPLQESPVSPKTYPLPYEDVKRDVRSDFRTVSRKPSETSIENIYDSDVAMRQKKMATDKSNALQSVRHSFSETPSEVMFSRSNPSHDAKLETHGERAPNCEKQFTFGDDDEEICSITMRITRDAKVGPQVGVSISEYGTGSVEVSRLDTPTIQKVANLVLRRNSAKQENERFDLKVDESTNSDKESDCEIVSSERGPDQIGIQALHKEASPSFRKTDNRILAKHADASEFMESTAQSSIYSSGKNSLDTKRDIESRPWRKPGQIPVKKTIGGISAVSVCPSPFSDREALGSSKSVPPSNEYDKHGAFQESSTKFSVDDGSWTIFSGNEAFTLQTSISGSILPPPPPKVPHPSQLGVDTSEAHILHDSFPISENIKRRSVSRSPQPSASSTTISDFTLSSMRQTSQSPKMNQKSRSASQSPRTTGSIPPPPPRVPHPSQSSDTSDEALKARHSLPGVESKVLRSGSRSPQPSASSTMSSDFTLRDMRQVSLSPKNSVLRSDLSSSQPRPSRTEMFDPFELEAETGETSQSPKNIQQRSVSRSPQKHRLQTDEFDLFSQPEAIRQVSPSPTNMRQRPVSRSPQPHRLHTDASYLFSQQVAHSPTIIRQRSVLRSPQEHRLHTDKFDLFTQHEATRQVTQSPASNRQRSVSRSSPRNDLNNDDFVHIERQRWASQSPTKFKPQSFSISSQSSASPSEPFERFSRSRDRSVSRSPPKLTFNDGDITSRSASRSPEPNVYQTSSDRYRKSSRAVSRSPDSDRSLNTSVGDAQRNPPVRGLDSQSSQASFSSTNDNPFTLRRSVSRSPQSRSVSSSATSDTFTLRNMRSVSSSPTPSIPRLDLSREENNEIRKILTEPKSSRRLSQLSSSPEKSSATSSQHLCPSPLRLSPTVVSAFENINLELGGDVLKGVVRKVTFDDQVQVRAFVNDSLASPSRENKKLSKISKWTSKWCGCLRPPPKRVE